LNKLDHTKFIKSVAAQLGFHYCGIAKAVKLDDDARRLEQWLNKGLQGSMKYMENYFDLRTDPRRLVPGANSVITLLLNYFPAERQQNNAPKISKYAYGKDYHEVIRPKLQFILAQMKEKKILDPWKKYSGDFISEDAFLETLFNSLTGQKNGKFIKHN